MELEVGLSDNPPLTNACPVGKGIFRIPTVKTRSNSMKAQDFSDMDDELGDELQLGTHRTGRRPSVIRPTSKKGAESKKGRQISSIQLGKEASIITPYKLVNNSNHMRSGVLPAITNRRPYPITASKRKACRNNGYSERKGGGQSNHSSTGVNVISQEDIDLMGSVITVTESLIVDGNYRQAAKLLLSDRVIPSGHPQKLLLLLDCYFGLEDMRRALDTARQFARIHSNLEVAHCSLAVCLSTVGRIEEAIDRCTDGIKLIRSSSKLHIQRGKLYKQSGMLKEALRDFDTARTLDLATHIMGSTATVGGPSFLLASP